MEHGRFTRFSINSNHKSRIPFQCLPWILCYHDLRMLCWPRAQSQSLQALILHTWKPCLWGQVDEVGCVSFPLEGVAQIHILVGGVGLVHVIVEGRALHLYTSRAQQHHKERTCEQEVAHLGDQNQRSFCEQGARKACDLLRKQTLASPTLWPLTLLESEWKRVSVPDPTGG